MNFSAENSTDNEKEQEDYVSGNSVEEQEGYEDTSSIFTPTPATSKKQSSVRNRSLFTSPPAKSNELNLADVYYGNGTVEKPYITIIDPNYP
eukprot:CAMPEP_0178917634 /NCGR_PEP_ID=MMETSP0786-20121207/13355_1 /TAXON_ID=186022 /ORGANISM="Thalassionema frauenfeldii, Strain CCMP 1798" /LENGTH=91 /DNA_ID=CAMNT_0020591205 /DNA_START=192 /DNA_END=467 /DNA_ORIENTATION=+